MDDYLIRAFLMGKKSNMSDEEFIHKMEEAFGQEHSNVNNTKHNSDKLFSILIEEEKQKHFNESTAYSIVSKLYHMHNGKKCIGEKYDIIKAKEIKERYRGIIPQSVTCADVYVAINSQYHDYCLLFKTWFGDNIDTKIIESAINFWFRDHDYTGDNKVYAYFNEE